ncbi:protein ACCELERATED CELL DEATH 6-like [Tasmannia lanceolata]|uniref:protein ACCELERATED CELL DEATH 6-like n=1 Tax=Tasmannia lanceolata TaxID=3420 RepID=UPI0040645AD5
MDPKLYKAATLGDVKLLKEIAQENSQDPLLSVTPYKNTILHITVRLGHENFARESLQLCRSLYHQANARGDTPLHIAARAGHFGLVKLLTDWYKKNSHVGYGENFRVRDLEAGGESEDWWMWNLEKSSPLHEALRNKHQHAALHLLEFEPRQACFVNNAGESPLYLAARLGLLPVLQRIVQLSSNFSQHGPDGKTPLHAAVIWRRFRSVQVLLQQLPQLVQEFDDSGKTALHYAAAKGFLHIVRLILQTDSSVAYKADKEGQLPLLMAAGSGRLLTVEVMLEFCQDPVDMVNTSGRNAVHLAVENNKSQIVRALLNRPEHKKLINEPDHEGNTPLHLATKLRFYNIVKLLLAADDVDLTATNKDGLTALDISVSDRRLVFRQIFIRRTLMRHGAARLGGDHGLERVPVILSPLDHPDVDLKSMSNTLSLVATLLATVTFAAAFTMPGGLKIEGPDEGMAVFARKVALKVFVLSDTVAMCSSITVAFLLVWGMLGDPGFLRGIVGCCMKLLMMALLATMITFMTGVYLVISKESLWVAIVVCVMSCMVPFLVYYLFNAYSTSTPHMIKSPKKIRLRRPKSNKKSSHRIESRERMS